MGALQKLNVVILGAGSIGCYLGGYLQSAGVPVTFIGRERVKWDLDMKGMTLTHYKRRPVHIARDQISYQLDYQPLVTADVILVCVKSQDTANVADTIAQIAPAQALIVSFQNGVSNADALRQVTARQGTARPTLAAIVPFNVTPSGRGEYHCGTEGDLIIEASDDVRLKTLVKAFKKSGIGVNTTKEIVNYQWGKLIINLNNALNALSGGTLRQGLSQKSYRRVCAAMMEEALNICRGAGIVPKSFSKTTVEKSIKVMRLPNVLFGPVMNNIIKIDENARSSMLDDLEAGKASEVEYLQGEIVRLSQQTAQFAPINLTILEQTKKAFAEAHSPRMSGDDLAALVGV